MKSKEEIKEWLKKYSGDYLPGDYTVDETIEIIIAYASQKGMAWVKASERLPEVPPEDETMQRFIVDDRNEEGYGKVWLMSYHDLKDLTYYNKTIQWLDEDAPGGDGWIDVASAPKDGSKIIGYDPNTEETYIVWWNRYMGNGCWNHEGNQYIPIITHWMPLPTPPEKD